MTNNQDSLEPTAGRINNSYTLIGITALTLALLLSIGLAALLIQAPSQAEINAGSVEKNGQDTDIINNTINEAPAKSITLIEAGQDQQLKTDAKSVGQLLDELNTVLYLADKVSPSPGSWLDDGDTVFIDRANRYSLVVNGGRINVLSHYTKTIDVLSDSGIGFAGLDKTIPGPADPLTSGDQIEVIRVTDELLIEEEIIPYEAIWQGTEDLEIDQKALLSSGIPGKRVKQTRLRFENGAETGQAIYDWVAAEPVNELFGYGTRIDIRTMDTPEGTIEYWRVVRMRVTAYTPSSAGKPADHPGYGITASGVPAGKGVVAIDPKVVPFRSQVYVPGYGTAFAGDTGGGVKGRWIDLGYSDGEIESWRGYVDVYYLTPVPPSENINFLIPEQLP